MSFAVSSYSQELFPSAEPAQAVPAEEAESYTYQMLRSGPDVNPGEVELQNVDAVEVTVCWGRSVLAIRHLGVGQSFHIGEQGTKEAPVDFVLPVEKLGASRLPLVVQTASGPCLVVPQGAAASAKRGQHALSLEELHSESAECPESPGAWQWPLSKEAEAALELNGFRFLVRRVSAGKPSPAGIADNLDWNTAAYFGASFLGVGSMLLSMAFFMPPMGLTNGETSIQDQLILLQQYQSALSEREQEPDESPAATAANSEGGQGERAQDEEGSMGKKDSPAKNKMYAVKGPSDNADPHLARHEALASAAEFGMIGVIASVTGDPDAPTAPWGRDTSLGVHEQSAMGNLWGDEIGDASGTGGLGLSGVGEGGGGRGIGIGLDSVGTIGRGAGGGDDMGFGRDGGRGLQGSHRTRTPRMGAGVTTVSGRLPPQVIQRIVRQNFGRFRLCYEKGLIANPNLEGRVSVRFVIGRDGAVASASNGGSSLPDASVVSCVVSAYYGLSFPKPEGGIVTVSYPLTFNPG